MPWTNQTPINHNVRFGFRFDAILVGRVPIWVTIERIFPLV
jgi:hypothetical protein